MGWTEVEPIERLEYIKNLIISESYKVDVFMYSALQSCLTTPEFYPPRMVFEESLGSKPLPSGWNPKNWGEIFSFYETVWSYLIELLDKLSDSDKKDIIEIMLSASRFLVVLNKEIGEMVLETFKLLISENMIDKLSLLKKVLNIIIYDSKRVDEQIMEKWKTFQLELMPTEYREKIKIYVGWDDLELSKIDESLKNEDNIETKIKELALDIIEEREDLESIKDLIRDNGLYRSWTFGKVLAEIDEEFLLLDKIIQFYSIDSQEIDIRFISGYLYIISIRDQSKFLEILSQLDGIFNNKKLLFETIHRFSINDDSVQFLSRIIQEEDLDSKSISTFNRGLRGNISENIFIEFLESIIEKFPKNGSLVAINSIFFYYDVYKSEKSLPLDFSKKLIFMPIFWEYPELLYPREQPLLHNYNSYWKLTLIKLLNDNPDLASEVMEKLVLTIQNSEEIFKQKDDLEVIFDNLIELNPDLIWE